jgi:hypothetical protein
MATAVAQDACYVFGIVPTDENVAAVLERAAPSAKSSAIVGIRLVSGGELSAVVGTVRPDKPLGTAADLRLHDGVLADLVTAGIPVLPSRFGAVMTDEQAVTADFLEPHRPEFTSALEYVTGRAQYTVRAWYEQDTALLEVLAQHPEIAALRQPGRPASMTQQLRLGEMVVKALEQMRPSHADELLAALNAAAAGSRTHELRDADEVLHVALLVDQASSGRFDETVEDCGRRWAGQLRIRLVGPLAPYDFVPGA